MFLRNGYAGNFSKRSANQKQYSGTTTEQSRKQTIHQKHLGNNEITQDLWNQSSSQVVRNLTGDFMKNRRQINPMLSIKLTVEAMESTTLDRSERNS